MVSDANAWNRQTGRKDRPSTFPTTAERLGIAHRLATGGHALLLDIQRVKGQDVRRGQLPCRRGQTACVLLAARPKSMRNKREEGLGSRSDNGHQKQTQKSIRHASELDAVDDDGCLRCVSTRCRCIMYGEVRRAVAASTECRR